MKTQDYIKLSDRIAWKNRSLVEDILSHNEDLDLLHKNGKFFKMAIEDNSTDIVEILLEYFQKNQFGKYDSQSIEYYNLRTQLVEVIEIALDEVTLSAEMKKILSLYIDFDGSEHNDSFIDDEQMHGDLIIKDQVKIASIKKSYSANDLHNSTFDNSKENLLTEENLKKFSHNSSEEKFKFIEEFLEHRDAHEIKNDDLSQKEHHSDLAGNLHNTDEF